MVNRKSSLTPQRRFFLITQCKRHRHLIGEKLRGRVSHAVGGAPLLLLQAAREKRVTHCTSTPMLAELTDILGRRKFEKKIAASRLSVDELVDHCADVTILVRPVRIVGIAPDPDDDVVIGTALAAQAESVVKGDKPLLSVVSHQGVRIIRVSEVVQKIYPEITA